MKKTNLIPLILMLCFMTSISKAIDPTYTLQLKNVCFKSDTALEFDIYLFNTSNAESNSDFEYANGQYFINFNPAILNDGAGKYTMLASELPNHLRPINLGVVYYGAEAVLKLATNTPAKGYFISKKKEGILIAKMRLTVSDEKLNVNQSPNLEWRDNDLICTKIHTYMGSRVLQITTPNTHSIDALYNMVTKQTALNVSSLVKTDIELSVYPNPVTNNVINFSINLHDETIQSVIVVDMLGKSIELNNANAIDQYQINFDSNVPSGLYYLRLTTNKGQYVKKFSILK